MTVLKDELVPRLWMKAMLVPSGMTPLSANGLPEAGLSPGCAGSVVVQPTIFVLLEMEPGETVNELASKLGLGMVCAAATRARAPQKPRVVRRRVYLPLDFIIGVEESCRVE